MARTMYFECFAGAAGDMVMGALLDAGLPADALRSALGTLGVGHDLVVSRVVRSGIAATHVEVRDRTSPASRQAGQSDGGAHHHHGDHSHSHPHSHHHHHDPGHDHAAPAPHGHEDHGHRSLSDIEQLIGSSALSSTAKSRAISMFRRLAAAEAAIHDMPIERVHLHEVGALDSIIDIAGAAFAMEWFGIDDVVASAVNVGSGHVHIAHGTFPVPAPATLRLLVGVPVYSRGPAVELTTPTGALVVSTYAREYGAMPAMTVERTGYGAGTRDFEHFPNVLRVTIGERSPAAASMGEGDVLRIESEIDDMSPQLFTPVMDQLLAAGALDVFLTPVIMKKGRPGTLLTVLAAPDRRPAVCDVIFRETTTIGVRFDVVQRETLAREWVDVALDHGMVRIKVARRGGTIVNAAPEFEDCLRLAAATGEPIKAVQAAAMRAWYARPQA